MTACRGATSETSALPHQITRQLFRRAELLALPRGPVVPRIHLYHTKPLKHGRAGDFFLYVDSPRWGSPTRWTMRGRETPILLAASSTRGSAFCRGRVASPWSICTGKDWRKVPAKTHKRRVDKRVGSWGSEIVLPSTQTHFFRSDPVLLLPLIALRVGKRWFVGNAVIDYQLGCLSGVPPLRLARFLAYPAHTLMALNPLHPCGRHAVPVPHENCRGSCLRERRGSNTPDRLFGC